MEKQTFPSCWSKDKAARRAERTIFTILYILGREGWVILVFRFHFDQNSVDVLGSLPADVLWGSFVTHLLNAWRTNPKGPLRGGYVLGRRNWKVMSISVSSLATKESRIISQLPVTLKRVFFFLKSPITFWRRLAYQHLRKWWRNKHSFFGLQQLCFCCCPQKNPLAAFSPRCSSPVIL